MVHCFYHRQEFFLAGIVILLCVGQRSTVECYWAIFGIYSLHESGAYAIVACVGLQDEWSSPHDEPSDSIKGSRGMYFAVPLYIFPVNSDARIFAVPSRSKMSLMTNCVALGFLMNWFGRLDYSL